MSAATISAQCVRARAPFALPTCAPLALRHVGCSTRLALAPPARSRHSRPTHARRNVVVAGWGDPVEWAACTVVDSKPVAKGITRLVVDLGDRASGFTKPGQFVQFRIGDSKPAFIALASAPGAPMELLVKQQGPESTADLICALEKGAQMECSPVMGNGFPLDAVPSSEFPTLLFFATGTGIAPVKSVIESGAADLAGRKAVKVYFGARDEDHDPLRGMDTYAQWAKLGIDIEVALSGPEKRYVQDAFKNDENKPDIGPGTAVVLVGQKEMANAVKEQLSAMGVEKFLTNF